MNKHLSAFVLLVLLIATALPLARAQDDTVIVMGTATEDIDAEMGRYADTACTVAADENVLAVAQNSAGEIMFYAGGEGCEGPTWIAARAAGSVEWDGNLDDLPRIQRPKAPTRRGPLQNLSDFDEVCEGAARGSYWPEERPLLFYAGSHNNSFPDDMLATSRDEVKLVVCYERNDVQIGSCPYTGGHTLLRKRPDVTITIVNYETGGFITYQTFYGTSPPYCPSVRGFNWAVETSMGDPPDADRWITWVTDRINSIGSGGPVRTRTTVNASPLNVRSEATTDSEILGQLQWGTPVNPIARNAAGDWVVALLPDMTKGWLYEPLLLVANETDLDALPVFEGEASEAPIPVPES
jgi:hypothetical protein